MIKVIATDLDGTLLIPKKKHSIIEKESKKFIQSFYGDIVFATGRTPKFCAKLANSLKIEHNFVALNGAVIVKNGNVIYRQSLKKTSLNSLFDFINEYYSDFEFLIFDKYDEITCYTPNNISKTKRKYKKIAHQNGKLSEKITINNKKFMSYLNDSTDIHKAIIYTNKNHEDMGNLLYSKFADHFSIFVCDHSIEISPLGVNKGDALQYLIDTTALTNDDVLVIGDSTNDISMFELFSNSFAINSDKQQILSKANYIIDKFSDLKQYTRVNKNFH